MKQETFVTKVKYYWNLILGKTSAIRPAKLSFRNIWAVIQSWTRRSIGGVTVPQYMYEQIIWRRIQIANKSPMCWQSGHCIVCGCEILGKTMEDRGCAKSEDKSLGVPCFPEMMNKEEWEEFKSLNKIKLYD